MLFSFYAALRAASEADFLFYLASGLTGVLKLTEGRLAGSVDGAHNFGSWGHEIKPHNECGAYFRKKSITIK